MDRDVWRIYIFFDRIRVINVTGQGAHHDRVPQGGRLLCGRGSRHHVVLNRLLTLRADVVKLSVASLQSKGGPTFQPEEEVREVGAVRRH